MRCLQCFSSEKILTSHKDDCILVNGTQAIRTPTKDNNDLKYNNHHKQLPAPFVIYADFEAITKKIAGCRPNLNNSYTEVYQKHEDCGYGYKLICRYDDQYSKPIKIYRGEKAVEKFMRNMLEEVRYCKRTIEENFTKPLKTSEDNENDFNKADRCHICDNKYAKNDTRVRDHCHITGQYRGSAHQDCNLKIRINSDSLKIPVIFHNLRGYDSHFIMQEIGKIALDGKLNINVIPNNMEKYLAFMLGKHLIFIDSFQFMSSSLDRLVSNLPRDLLKYTSMTFQDDKLDLMARKGIYPYDYMDSFERFLDDRLPRKKAFYSIMNEETYIR